MGQPLAPRDTVWPPPSRCGHCRVALADGEFVLSLAFRPSGLRPDAAPESVARFPLCADCARAIAGWAAEDLTARPPG